LWELYIYINSTIDFTCYLLHDLSDICKTQIDVQPLIEVQSSNPSPISTSQTSVPQIYVIFSNSQIGIQFSNLCLFSNSQINIQFSKLKAEIEIVSSFIICMYIYFCFSLKYDLNTKFILVTKYYGKKLWPWNLHLCLES
jgi:hypothetical protein